MKYESSQRAKFLLSCILANPYLMLIQEVSLKSLSDAFSVFPLHRKNLVVRFGVKLVR